MLSVEALPLLLTLDERPAAAIFDPDRSGTADEIRQAGVVQVYELRAAADAPDAARESSRPLVAFNLPTGWENSSGALTVDGYVAHWIGAGEAAEIARDVAAAFTAVTTRPLAIQPQTVYPTLEHGGQTLMVGLGLVLAAVMITAILVPHLILEEKTTHTLDLLRVSPVSDMQVILGKAIAGLVYGIVAASVLLLFNLRLVVQWPLLLPALLGIILFGVGLGLLVGLLVENQGSVQLWIGLFTMVLIFPLMLVFMDPGRMPAWLPWLFNWLPTNAAFDLIRLSFGDQFPAGMVAARLGALTLGVILIYVATAAVFPRFSAKR